MKFFTTVVLVFSFQYCFAQISFKVEDALGNGVYSKVCYYKSDGTLSELGPTKHDGTFSYKGICDDAGTFRAIPIVEDYSASPKTYCGEVVTKKKLVVGKIQFANNLKLNGNILESRESYAEAARIYFELAKSSADSTESNVYTIKAYSMAAKELNITKPFVYDDDQTHMILSQKLIKSISKFQKNNGLSVDGTISEQTLEKLSSEKASSMKDYMLGVVPSFPILKQKKQ